MRTEVDLVNQELMYELHAKDLTQTEALKQIADHTVKEIKATVGWDTDVEVTIEPETKDKHLFSVCMVVYGAGEPIVVKKQGKHVMAVLKKVRKTVLRQLHRIGKKRLTSRRRSYLREQFAS
jgi:ribosome-associated translation inhibitor RaiA